MRVDLVGGQCRRDGELSAGRITQSAFAMHIPHPAAA